MVRLDEYARNVYSQFGEDGMLAYLLDVIRPVSYRCAEVGAGDGVECSNTALLWRTGKWKAVLIETAPDRYASLEVNTLGFDVEISSTGVTSANVNELFVGDFDVLSLDIDGDDWFVLSAMTVRPRVLVLEFNPTVPYWVYLRPAEEGHQVGASALAVLRLAESMGYRLVGATHCNLILLRVDVSPEVEFVDDLGELVGTSSLTYLATDFTGRPFVLGHPSPWGIHGGFGDPCTVPMVFDEELA